MDTMSCLTLKTFKQFENLSKLSYLSVLEWQKWRSSRSTIITKKFHRFLQSRNAKCFGHLERKKQIRRTVTETISTNTGYRRGRRGGGKRKVSGSRFLNPRRPDYLEAWNWIYYVMTTSQATIKGDWYSRMKRSVEKLRRRPLLGSLHTIRIFFFSSF